MKFKVIDKVTGETVTPQDIGADMDFRPCEFDMGSFAILDDGGLVCLNNSGRTFHLDSERFKVEFL
ncbi:hypothetical protein [Methanobrevibacter sp. DSM 116169]|uniref:hypothetical protein n=1 Tax=Methanobrevibacter sp. DSM 116169 TaxID=3242727 RepID=UPI0038FC029C